MSRVPNDAVVTPLGIAGYVVAYFVIMAAVAREKPFLSILFGTLLFVSTWMGGMSVAWGWLKTKTIWWVWPIAFTSYIALAACILAPSLAFVIGWSAGALVYSCLLGWFYLGNSEWVVIA